MASDKLINDMMGSGLRILSKVTNSPIVERLGLEEQAQQLVYSGAKKAFETATQAAQRFGKNKPRDATKKPARLFDLSLTDEQALMRETLKRFSAEAIRPNAEKADSDVHPPQSFFDAFAELGAASFAIPEFLGGAADEVSVVSNMLVAEDLAWGDMGLALAGLSPLSLVHALVRWGSDAQRDRYLAPYALGEYPHAAFAMLEATPSFDPSALKTTLSGRSGKLMLRGQKVLVPLGATAATFLVAAKSSLGPRLVIVDREAEGVSVKPTPAMGLRSAGLSTVTLKDVRVDEAMLLGGSDIDKPTVKSMFAECIERQSVAWGALSIGNSQAILDYVIPYANDRIAFGEPISHRQAVAFMIADIAVELEAMRMLVYRAAGRIDAGLRCEREAYLSRVLCNENSMKIGTDGVQVLGGAGFIKDHPMERWYRHARSVGVMHGGVLV